MKCTLKEAIELCEKKGGRFKADLKITRWWYVDEDGKVIDEDSGFFPLEVGDFDSIWIYEPPKSAFQEWKETITDPYHDEKYQEGWNGFGKTLKELLLQGNFSLPSHVTAKIDEMMEE